MYNILVSVPTAQIWPHDLGRGSSRWFLRVGTASEDETSAHSAGTEFPFPRAIPNQDLSVKSLWVLFALSAFLRLLSRYVWVWRWDHATRRWPIRSVTFKKIWGIWNTWLEGVVRERCQALDWTIIYPQARCIAGECCSEGCYGYSSHLFFRFFNSILSSRRALPRDKLSLVTK